MSKNIINFGNANQPFLGSLFSYFSFFDNNAQVDYPFPSATIFLPRWQVAVKNQRCILVTNIIINENANIQRLLENLQNKIEFIQSLEYYSANIDCFPAALYKNLSLMLLNLNVQ